MPLSALVSPAQLASMRHSLDASLPDRCEVRARVQAPDSTGATVDTWPATGVSVPCRIQTLATGVEQVQAGGILATQYWEIVVRHDVPVLPTDRVVNLVTLETFEVLVTDGAATHPVGQIIRAVQVL